MAEDSWLGDLKAGVEEDGVRIKKYRQLNPTTSQFVLSTGPHVMPKDVLRVVKGRLQYLVRKQISKAFKRNYWLASLGENTCQGVDAYISGQVDHHPMVDTSVQGRMKEWQISNQDVDLANVRSSSHGRFLYNLHLVFVHDGRWMEIEESTQEAVKSMICRASETKGHFLSKAGILPDHIHLAIGCGLGESPEEVALGYLNNLAFAQGMTRAYRFSYYAATFGNYDFGATADV